MQSARSTVASMACALPRRSPRRGSCPSSRAGRPAVATALRIPVVPRPRAAGRAARRTVPRCARAARPCSSSEPRVAEIEVDAARPLREKRARIEVVGLRVEIPGHARIELHVAAHVQPAGALRDRQRFDVRRPCPCRSSPARSARDRPAARNRSCRVPRNAPACRRCPARPRWPAHGRRVSRE